MHSISTSEALLRADAWTSIDSCLLLVGAPGWPNISTGGTLGHLSGTPSAPAGPAASGYLDQHRLMPYVSGASTTSATVVMMVSELDDHLAPGISRGWSRDLLAPWPIHEPIVCKTAACTRATHVRRLIMASAQTMVQLLLMVCETGSRSIECLKWGHFFQTARRLCHVRQA